MNPPDPQTLSDDIDVPTRFARQASLIAAGEFAGARALARRHARETTGPGRLLLIAPLVAALAARGEFVRAVRLQRFLLRRHPGVAAVEQDHVRLLAAANRSARAHAALLASLSREANQGDWLETDAAVAAALVLTGRFEAAWPLVRQSVAGGLRSWSALATLMWAGGSIGRAVEAMALAATVPARVVDAEGSGESYRLVRLCAAFDLEAEAMRWLLAPEGELSADLAWAAPYARRAGRHAPASPGRVAAEAAVRDAATPKERATHVVVVAELSRQIGGTEAHALQLAVELALDSPVSVRAIGEVHPAHAERGVRSLDDLPPPTGGVLIVMGGWHGAELPFELLAPDRVVLVVNSFDAPQTLRLIEGLARRTGRPVELVYVSALLRRELGLPGTVVTSPLAAGPVPARTRPLGAPVVVGRHSRDVVVKHHAEDPHVYAALLQQGCEVRLLGATCLSARLPSQAGLSVLAAAAGASAAFLESLDIFFYRTGARIEPLGRVVLEAMQAGLPVVIDGRGGEAEVVRDGIDGFVAPTTNAAVERLLALAADPALRARMGVAARARYDALQGPEARAALRQVYLGGAG